MSSSILSNELFLFLWTQNTERQIFLKSDDEEYIDKMIEVGTRAPAMELLEVKPRISSMENECCSVKEIKRLHEENDLAINQYSTSKQMIEKMVFKCPLDKLYSVIASCNYNIQNRFCPVLVEVKDQIALMKSNGKPYLLQVWNLNGECVFERSLQKPVANWNINNDIFIF